MKFLLKILLVLGFSFLFFGDGVFAEGDTCKDYKDKLVTTVQYNKDDSYFRKCSEDNGYKCYTDTDKGSYYGNCQKFYFDNSIQNKKGLSLIQSFLSTILGFVIKFGAMLAVLAIVIGGIQISMQMDGDGESIGKDKIVGGIAALVVLFFAGVILHFINPNYYKWGSGESNVESPAVSDKVGE